MNNQTSKLILGEKELKDFNTKLQKSVMETLKKISKDKGVKLKAGKELIDKYTDGEFELVISSENPDREGDIVIQKGIDFTNYWKNPIVLFNHNRDNILPIGYTTEIRLSEDENGVPITIAKGRFASAEVNPLAQQIRKAWESKMMNTSSIGFINKEFEYNLNENGEMAQGMTIKRSEMFEYSLVIIPCNSDANKIKKIPTEIDGVVMKDFISAMKSANYQVKTINTTDIKEKDMAQEVVKIVNKNLKKKEEKDFSNFECLKESDVLLETELGEDYTMDDVETFIAGIEVNMEEILQELDNEELKEDDVNMLETYISELEGRKAELEEMAENMGKDEEKSEKSIKLKGQSELDNDMDYANNLLNTIDDIYEDLNDEGKDKADNLYNDINGILEEIEDMDSESDEDIVADYSADSRLEELGNKVEMLFDDMGEEKSFTSKYRLRKRLREERKRKLLSRKQINKKNTTMKKTDLQSKLKSIRLKRKLKALREKRNKEVKVKEPNAWETSYNDYLRDVLEKMHPDMKKMWEEHNKQIKTLIYKARMEGMNTSKAYKSSKKLKEVMDKMMAKTHGCYSMYNFEKNMWKDMEEEEMEEGKSLKNKSLEKLKGGMGSYVSLSSAESYINNIQSVESSSQSMIDYLDNDLREDIERDIENVETTIGYYNDIINDDLPEAEETLETLNEAISLLNDKIQEIEERSEEKSLKSKTKKKKEVIGDSMNDEDEEDEKDEDKEMDEDEMEEEEDEKEMDEDEMEEEEDEKEMDEDEMEDEKEMEEEEDEKEMDEDEMEEEEDEKEMDEDNEEKENKTIKENEDVFIKNAINNIISNVKSGKSIEQKYKDRKMLKEISKYVQEGLSETKKIK